MKTRLQLLMLMCFGIFISYGQHTFVNSKINNLGLEVKTNRISELTSFEWDKSIAHFIELEPKTDVKLSFSVKKPGVKYLQIKDAFKSTEKNKDIHINYEISLGRKNKIKQYTFVVNGKADDIEEMLSLIKDHIDFLKQNISS
mgnify:FL=1